MIKKQRAQEIIGFLNELIYYDAKAVNALIKARVGCNGKMAQHPSVQVGKNKSTKEYEVGLLGILNGFCGVFDDGPKEGWGPITGVTDAYGNFIRFEQTRNE